MPRKILYREYDKDGNLIKLECTHCHEIKSVDNFYKRKTNKSKDGVNPKCKKCICEKQREYQSQHKEERKAYNKKYQKDNKEKLRQYRHDYRKNNIEKLIKNNKIYYENNKETIMKQHTEYRHRNKDKIKLMRDKYTENNKDKITQWRRLYQENNRKKVRETNRKYYYKNKEKESERKHLFYENNKDKVLERCANYRNDNVNKELQRIYENVTKQLYPYSGIQYGIIYGVYCKATDRWYIGQTTKTFKLRYLGNFFRYKFNDLSEDSEKGQLLKYDIEKYGQESFEIFEVLDVAFSEKELDEKEAYYIDYYNAYEEGYNTNRGYIFKHDKSKRKEVI